MQVDLPRPARIDDHWKKVYGDGIVHAVGPNRDGVPVWTVEMIDTGQTVSIPCSHEAIHFTDRPK